MYLKEPLKYNEDSLEPIIGTRTMTIHYNNYYLKYLENLNKLLVKNNYDYRYSKEELVDHIDIFNIKDRDDILYNLGGVINHELYFNSMSNKNNIYPLGSLKDKINKDFGSYDNFKKEFIKTSKELVGSGYTFLVLNKEKNLQIINTSNQETPYLYGFIPLITLDLFEHAYYLDYQNNKDVYINNFFLIIDFENANKIYEKNK